MLYTVACRPVARRRPRGDCTAAVAKQRPANSNIGRVFSVLSVPSCYKQDNWSNELLVEQSPVGKNVSTEADDIVGFVIRQRLVKTQQAEKLKCVL
jgi:hypothetical protein